MQNNVFYDIGKVTNSFKNLFNGSESTSFQSVGAGVRFVFPKIFRLNLRLDIAQGLNFNKPTGISFGLQQFFWAESEVVSLDLLAIEKV